MSGGGRRRARARPTADTAADTVADTIADVVAGVAGLVTVAAMIATPLAPPRSATRRALSTVVVAGMFATTTANASRRWGPRRALRAAAVVAVATGAVERFGTATGVPFGRYAYTGALRPQIAHVPVIVPLAWFAMGLPSREAAHAALGSDGSRPARLALGAAAMTAWDLFLDPQMVGEGYWSWARRGAYRGIPASNYLGWALTGLGLMAALEALLPVDAPRGPDRAPRRADVRLTGQYGYVSVMQTLGFARFFRDPLVAAAGGAAMLPTAAVAAVRLARHDGERS